MTTSHAPADSPATDNARPRLVDWGARSALAAPVLALVAVAVGFPLYTVDMATAAATDRVLVANAATLGVLLLLLLALIGRIVHGQHRLGALGHVAAVLAVVGTVLAAGGAWDALFAQPYLADVAPEAFARPTGGTLLAGFLLSYLVLALGWMAYAVASLRARLTDRAAGVLVVCGAALAVLPAPTAIRVLPLALGCAWVGWRELRSRER